MQAAFGGSYTFFGFVVFKELLAISNVLFSQFLLFFFLFSHGFLLNFSNNFRRFRLDGDAVAEFAHCEDISASTIPPDFERNARIHRAWRLTRA